MTTTKNDRQLDELIANLDTIATQHAEAITALADLDQRLDNGDPTATRQAVRDATDEKEHQARLLAGAQRRLDEYLATIPATKSSIELDATQEAARAEARARLADTRVELATSQKAVEKAQKALDKANEKHAEILADVTQQAHGVGGIDVELAEAFAHFTQDLFAGPTTIGHKAMQAPAIHEAPMLHIVQAQATDHRSIVHNVGTRSVVHAGKARGTLTVTYYTRPGFTAPSGDAIVARLGAVGWKTHISATTTASTDGRLTSTQYTITVSDGHVLAHIVDPGVDCGAPSSTWGLDATALDQQTVDGITITRAGVRLTRSVRDERWYGQTERERTLEKLTEAVDELTGKVGWHGTIRAAEIVDDQPAWAARFDARLTPAKGWVDAIGYGIVTMHKRAAEGR